MSVLLVRADARAAMGEEKRLALKHAGERLELGEPAFFLDPDGVEWAAYDDPRFTLLDAARGARIVANAASFPDFVPTGKSRAEIHAEDVRFATAKNVVLPDAVPHAEGADRIAEVWAAQNPPAWAKMTSEVPVGWAPKSLNP